MFIALWILHVLWTSLWNCQQHQGYRTQQQQQQQQQVIFHTLFIYIGVLKFDFLAEISDFFLEQVTIPESYHDIVTPVVSDSDPRDNIHDRIRDTSQHNKPRHKFRVKSQRKSQKTFEFSNELLDRYVRPKKSNGENFSERGRGHMDQV